MTANEFEWKPRERSIITIGRVEAIGHNRKLRSCIRLFIHSIFISLILLMSDHSPGYKHVASHLAAANNRTSELNFEGQNLAQVPTSQICSMVDDLNSGAHINVVSLAHNKIQRIEPNAFECLAASLKILVLRNNEIYEISGAAFRGLSYVQVLLLEHNQLTSVPSVESLRPMKSLRHLNLARNRITQLDDFSFVSGDESSNLISLNLDGNPLHLMSPDSLVNLAKLKTLSISQSALSGQLIALNGLTELRFYHVDRGSNLRSVAENLCQSSRKLSSLVLKSNRLQRVPQFDQCQNLLQMDFSYNEIGNSLDLGNLTKQTNLIDLYLGHNQIEAIGEFAFSGLERLQVLELNNNRIKWIHPSAFLPVKNSIQELNLAHNSELKQLSSLGLELLLSFKSYGNHALRRLPVLRSAKRLALTYAYHCCDYLHKSSGMDQRNSMDDIYTNGQSSSGLLKQLISSLLSRLSRLFISADGIGTSGQRLTSSSSSGNESSAMNELVLWPQAASKRVAEKSGRRAEPEVDVRPLLRAQRQPRKVANGAEKLIYDLVSELQQVRSSHSVSSLRLAQDTNHIKRIPEKVMGHKWELHNNAALESSTLMRFGPSSRQLEKNIEDDGGQYQPASATAQSKTRGPFERMVSGQVAELMRHSFRQLRNSRSVVSSRRLFERIERNTLDNEDNNDRYVEPATSGDYPPQNGGDNQLPAASPVSCLPEPSAFFPCNDLFDGWWLRLGIWCVFLLSFAGNILVIIVLGSVRQSSSSSALTNIMWLAHSKRHIDVPRFLVINLAIADLIMALYLGILAFVDLSTLGEFRLFAIKWQYSSGCKLAGFLGVLSSELSVFILAIITLERNYAITNAVHLNRRLSLHKAMFIMFIGYSFALMMALMPLNGISDYRKFSICLPLDYADSRSPLIGGKGSARAAPAETATTGEARERSKQPEMDDESSLLLLSWSQIYLITLISINALSFILLLGCYLRMYCAIRGSQAWNTNDLRIAKRMSILVMTDFLCWMPIIVCSVASLFGHHLVGPNGIKLLTIFILPLNSVANPFLYAITTKKFKRDLDTLLRRLRSIGSRLIHRVFCSCCCSKPGDSNDQFSQKDMSKFPAYYLNNNQYQRNMIMLMDKRNRRHEILSGQRTQQRFEGDFEGSRPLLNCDGSLRCHRKPHNRPASKSQRANQTANQVTVNRTTCSCNRQPVQCLASEAITTDQLRLKGQQPPPQLPVEIRQSSPETSRRVCRSSLVIQTTSGRGTSDKVGRQHLRSSQRLVKSPIERVIATCATPTGSRDIGAVGTDINQRPSYLLNVHQAADRSASACGHLAPTSRACEATSSGQQGEANAARASGSCGAMRTGSNERSLEKLSRSINRILFNPVAKAWSSIQISLNSSATHLQPAPQPNQIPRQSSTSGARMQRQPKGSDKHPGWFLVDDELLLPDDLTIDDLLATGIRGHEATLGSRELFSFGGRSKERRMSRSCDYIKSPPPHIQLRSPTSSACNEPTTTTSTMLSHEFEYEYDDQRTLLATINRLAAVKSRNKRREASGQRHPVAGKAPTSLSPPGGQLLQRGGRCTRCRSWSPSLLGKLEDCIYQIRSRIPKLSNVSSTREDTNNERGSQTQHEEDNGSQLSFELEPEVAGEQRENLLQSAAMNGGQLDQSDDGEQDDEREDEAQFEEDQFNERALDEERTVGQLSSSRSNLRSARAVCYSKRRRRLRPRLQQQASGNSDTLSTRTGNTCLTNMSMSFDSTNSIPVQQPTQLADPSISGQQ